MGVEVRLVLRFVVCGLVAACIAAALPASAQVAAAPAETLKVAATVVAAARKEFPEVELTLGALAWPEGTLNAPERLTAMVSFAGPLDLSSWETRARMGGWYLMGGDRIDCGLRRDRMTGRYYVVWLQRTAGGGKAPDTAPVAPIKLELSISPNPAKAGAPVKFDFSVTNVSGRPVTYDISSGQKFDIIVSRGSQVVWNWAHNKFFTMALQKMKIEPGKAVRFSDTWDLVGNDGKKVAPGTYLARAVFTVSQKEPPETTPVELVVKQ